MSKSTAAIIISHYCNKKVLEDAQIDSSKRVVWLLKMKQNLLF